MTKYNENDGVWRTVGGRRIFIKNGQSLSDAMKTSGKFTSHKKATENKLKEGRKSLAKSYSDEELKREIDSYKGKNDEFSKKRMAELEEESKERVAKSSEGAIKETRERLEREIEQIDKKANEYYQEEKRYNEEARKLKSQNPHDPKKVGELFEKAREAHSKNVEQVMKRRELEDAYDSLEKKSNKQVATNLEKQKHDYGFTKEQLDKVWENEDSSDVYDYLTGKEQRMLKEAYMNDDQKTIDRLDNEAASRFIENNSPDYIKKSKSVNKDAKEKIVQKTFEKADYGIDKETSKKFDKINHETFKKAEENRSKYTIAAATIPYDALEEISDFDEDNEVYTLKGKFSRLTITPDFDADDTNFDDEQAFKIAAKPGDEKLIDEFVKEWTSSHKYENRPKATKGSSNDSYKKAFAEYKKKHPNSKMTLQKFIDTSEGK